MVLLYVAVLLSQRGRQEKKNSTNIYYCFLGRLGGIITIIKTGFAPAVAAARVRTNNNYRTKTCPNCFRNYIIMIIIKVGGHN